MSEINNSAIYTSNSELPAGWRWVRLGEVCEIIMGQSPVGSSYNSDGRGVPLLNGPTEFGLINPTPVQWTTSPTRFAEVGDILLCVRGATTGRKNVADKKYCVGRGLAAIRGRDDKAINEFLWYCLDIATNSLLRETSGSTFPNLPREKLNGIKIPLPPIFEQKRITSKIQELMQEVERARNACEKQLEAAKALPPAYLREVFENEEAKRWERKRLGDVCEIIMGQSPPSDSYNKEKIGLPFFQGKADFGKYFPLPQAWCSFPLKLANANDVLISVRAPVGPVNMADQECCIGRGLTALRGKEPLDPWFLFFYFKSVENNWKGRGSTFDAIKKDDLVSMIIPLSHDLPEQKRIAAELKEKMVQVENLQSAILNQQSALNVFPQAILRKAFRGEL